MTLHENRPSDVPRVRIRMTMAIGSRPNGSEIQMSFRVVVSDRTGLVRRAWVDPIACDLLDRTLRRVNKSSRTRRSFPALRLPKTTKGELKLEEVDHRVDGPRGICCGGDRRERGQPAMPSIVRRPPRGRQRRLRRDRRR